MFIRISAFVFGFLFYLPQNIHASDLMFVRADHLTCVQENIEAYKAYPGEQILIFLSACPETDLSVIFQKRTQNSALPTVDKRGSTPDNPADVVMVNRRQLNCLTNIKISDDSKIITLPEDICDNTQ